MARWATFVTTASGTRLSMTMRALSSIRRGEISLGSSDLTSDWCTVRCIGDRRRPCRLAPLPANRRPTRQLTANLLASSKIVIDETPALNPRRGRTKTSYFALADALEKLVGGWPESRIDELMPWMSTFTRRRRSEDGDQRAA